MSERTNGKQKKNGKAGDVYKRQELYYKKVLGDSRNALAVDIGWAGSGAIALDYLVQNLSLIHI